MKTRNQKKYEYYEKFSDIPNTREEIIEYIKNEYNIDDIVEYDDIDILDNVIKIVLFEIPEGAKRPRARLCRSNLSKMAITNSSMIHIYSPCAKDDNMYLKRLINDDIIKIDKIINTPCSINITAFCETPKSFSKKEKLLAEKGVIRPLTYPDWDNIAKKYCDMFNKNIWLDDKLCVSGSVDKYYSLKPRLEITLKFANKVYIKKQINSVRQDINEVIECLI